MFKVGTIVPSYVDNKEEYFVVVEESSGSVQLEKLDDFIMRTYRVYDRYYGGYHTLQEILNIEKQKILNKGEVNVQSD